MTSWIHCIKDAMSLAKEREERVRSAIRENKIDKSLSDLVIYCQTVPFDLESEFLFEFKTDGNKKLLDMFVLTQNEHFSRKRKAFRNVLLPRNESGKIHKSQECYQICAISFCRKILPFVEVLYEYSGRNYMFVEVYRPG